MTLKSKCDEPLTDMQFCKKSTEDGRCEDGSTHIMLSVVILVDDDKVGKADEMVMMYESDASCTSYTALLAT